MTIGTRNRDRADLWYAQAKRDADGDVAPNSAIEALLLKDDLQDHEQTRPGLWLETCGTHSAANCLMATRRDPGAFLESFRLPGGGFVRLPDLLTLWMNTPQNRAKLLAARPNLDPDSLPGNEVPQYYPVAVAEVTGAACSYREGLAWVSILELLRQGSAVQLCLVKPGHYIAAVAYDDSVNQIIYIDPHPARQPKYSMRALMDRSEFEANVKRFSIIYPEEV